MTKNTNTYRLNNMLLNQQQVTEEIKEEIKIYLKTNDNEDMPTQKPLGYTKSSAKRQVYSHTSLPQKTRKASNKKSKLTLKANRKRTTNKQKKKSPKLIEGNKL